MTTASMNFKRPQDAPPFAALKASCAAHLTLAVGQNVPMICAEFSPGSRDWPKLAGPVPVQFAIGYGKHRNFASLLAEVEDAMVCGAHSIYCVSHPDLIEQLAARGIPVFGHTGLVPQICTGAGGLRAIGKTEFEADRLRQMVQRFESAGARGLYLQLVPQRLAAEVTFSTKMVTVSVGSGGGCDIVWAHAEDILGQNTAHIPRHAKVYATAESQDDTMCVQQFLSDVRAYRYPGPEHSV